MVDERDLEIQVGELQARHLGRVIRLGSEGRAPILVGRLLAVSHRYAERDHHMNGGTTELTVAWHHERITISERSSVRALLLGPGWDAEQWTPSPPYEPPEDPA